MQGKKSLRKQIRTASAAGKNNKAARLSKRLDKAGGNSAGFNKRVTSSLQAKDARGQLRSAIKSGDQKAVRGATRAVKATNTNAKRQGAALRIKKKMGYK